MPLAIVEAKDQKHAVGDGMQQGIHYDEILDVPIIDSNQNTKYYSDKSCRFLHHILIHRINSLLHSIGQEINFHSRKSKQNSLSKILLNSFIDINQNDEFIQINKPTISRMNDDSFEHQRYRELCEILKEVFSYFLDKNTTKRRLCSISLFLANSSPCIDNSTYLISSSFDKGTGGLIIG